jgi:hypothetical protein
VVTAIPGDVDETDQQAVTKTRRHPTQTVRADLIPPASDGSAPMGCREQEQLLVSNGSSPANLDVGKFSHGVEDACSTLTTLPNNRSPFGWSRTGRSSRSYRRLPRWWVPRGASLCAPKPAVADENDIVPGEIRPWQRFILEVALSAG